MLHGAMELNLQKKSLASDSEENTKKPLQSRTVVSELKKGEDRLRSAQTDGSVAEGRRFPEEALDKAKMVDEIEGDRTKIFKNSEVVFVTYASANHFEESREAIHLLRLQTNATLVYYDLGLGSDQVADLKNVCNVRVVPFNFSNYPSHARQLMTYAFKPIIIAEMYREYSAFWVIDASARLKVGKLMYKFYEKVRKGEVSTFSAEHPSGHTIDGMTVKGMYDYLPLTLKERSNGMNQALTMFVVRSPFAKEVVRWNLLCALVKDCIAPDQANLANHRFDQSSVSIIMCLAHLRRGLPCLSGSATTGAYSDFFGVARETYYKGPLPTC